ncbi:MAG: hypothetical protein WCJ30_25980 [Deltaproteobacteria bacterium]
MERSIDCAVLGAHCGVGDAGTPTCIRNAPDCAVNSSSCAGTVATLCAFGTSVRVDCTTLGFSTCTLVNNNALCAD